MGSDNVVRWQIRHHAVYPPAITLVMVAIGTLSLIFAAFCIWIGFEYPKSTELRMLKQVFIAIWITGPPTWLYLDYFFFYKHWGLPDSFGSFKHGQEVVSKFWIGISTLLSGLYFGSDVIHKLN